jgi:hypothetical protein
VAVPSLTPKPVAAVAVAVALNAAAGWVMVVDAVAVHPLASVTVAVYDPATNPVMEAVVEAGDVFQEKV